MELLTFKIEGWPRPQQRPRNFGHGFVSNYHAGAAAWKEFCRDYAKRHWKKRPIPAGVFLRVAFMFYLPRPKKPKWRFPCVPTEGDLNNLIKGTEDALNKVLWTDDRFIVADGGSFKAYVQPGQKPGALIRVEEV